MEEGLSEIIGDTLLQPMLLVTSGNITIDIPSYDSTLGR
jgi:hypothetical protein